MPFIYVYSPSDFVGGLPNESSSKAAGAGPFTLTLVADATPTLIEINDDDLIFDEIDSTQSLTSDVTLDGTTYTSGTTINTAYDLINTTSGHQVTSFHFGGNGYQQGPVDGLASTTPLNAGQSYTFDVERTSHQQPNQYINFTACLTAGTRVLTQQGEQDVETLTPGTLLAVSHDTFKPLRMLLHRRVSLAELARHPNLCPITISTGALGVGLPKRDLKVSPQHRMLITSMIAERMFGSSSVLVAAKKLLAVPGVFQEDPEAGVDYYHLVFEDHAVVLAEGAWTESFFPGPMAIAALPPQARDELLHLFPNIASAVVTPPDARDLKSAFPIPLGRLQRRLVERHVRNNKPLQRQSTTAV